MGTELKQQNPRPMIYDPEDDVCNAPLTFYSNAYRGQHITITETL